MPDPDAQRVRCDRAELEGEDGKEAHPEITLEEQSNDGLNAFVASHDLAVGSPKRFLIGLVANDQRLVSFGDAELAFSFLGNGESDAEPINATGSWQPNRGQQLDLTPTAPTVGDAVGGVGVNAARNATRRTGLLAGARHRRGRRRLQEGRSRVRGSPSPS